MKLPPNLGEVLARVQGERRNTLQHSISVLPRTWLTSWQGSIRKTAAASSTSVFSKRWAGVNLLPFSFPLPWRLFSANFACVPLFPQTGIVYQPRREKPTHRNYSPSFLNSSILTAFSPVSFSHRAMITSQ